jgi:hypothetical protein
MKKLALLILIFIPSLMIITSCGEEKPAYKPTTTVIIEPVGPNLLVLRPVDIPTNDYEKQSLIFLGKSKDAGDDLFFFWFKQKTDGKIEVICKTENSNRLPRDIIYIIVDTLKKTDFEIKKFAFNNFEKLINAYLNPGEKRLISSDSQRDYFASSLWTKAKIETSKTFLAYIPQTKSFLQSSEKTTKVKIQVWPSALVAILLLITALVAAGKFNKAIEGSPKEKKYLYKLDYYLIIICAVITCIPIDIQFANEPVVMAYIMSYLVLLIFSLISGYAIYSLINWPTQRMIKKIQNKNPKLHDKLVRTRVILNAGLIGGLTFIAITWNPIGYIWIPILIILFPGICLWTITLAKAIKNKV